MFSYLFSLNFSILWQSFWHHKLCHFVWPLIGKTKLDTIFWNKGGNKREIKNDFPRKTGMVSWSERVYLPTCRGATLQLTDDIFLARFFRAFFSIFQEPCMHIREETEILHLFRLTLCNAGVRYKAYIPDKRWTYLLLSNGSPCVKNTTDCHYFTTWYEKRKH